MFSLLSVRKNSVFILVFAEHVWILSYEFISETASKAVVRAAVVLFKLYERLTYLRNLEEKNQRASGSRKNDGKGAAEKRRN